MKSKFLKGLVGISMIAATGLFAEDLTSVSYYDCGYDADNPSKCMLYMPAAKLLATHTAGSLDDYAQVTGVEATFDNGTLTLPTVSGLSASDDAALSGRADAVDFYYIQQNVTGAGGAAMFYLYSPSLNYLAEHEAGKMGAENVSDISSQVTDGTFSYDVATGTASVGATPEPTTEPTPEPTADDTVSLTPPGVTDIPSPF